MEDTAQTFLCNFQYESRKGMEWITIIIPSECLLSCDIDRVTSFYQQFGKEVEYTESQSTEQAKTELKEFEASESITEPPISQSRVSPPTS